MFNMWPCREGLVVWAGLVHGTACQLSDRAHRWFALFQKNFQAEFMGLVSAYTVWVWRVPPLPGEGLR